MIQKIQFDDDLVVYRVKQKLNYDKEDIINKIEQNGAYANIKQLKRNGSYNVGIQAPFIIHCDELNDVENTANKIASEIYNCKLFINNTWSLILESDYKFPTNNSEENGWHDHPMVYALNKEHYISNITFVYYVQIPDNLKNNEGMLSFKTKNGNIYEILPEEGEFVFFSSDILHRAELSPNSAVPRIVVAGNMHFVREINIKHNNTLI